MISAFEWCHPTFTRLAKTWLQKYDKFSASFTDQVRLGYLDVAIAKKICKTCMPTCAIDLRQRLFRCSHRKKIISETCEKRSRKYLFRESWVHTIRNLPSCHFLMLKPLLIPDIFIQFLKWAYSGLFLFIFAPFKEYLQKNN